MKREKFGAKKENKPVGDDDASSKDSGDETNGRGAFSNSNTMENKENKPGLLCKRPIIFICDDAYSKGLRPLKRYCHNFKLEKNSDALIERLKYISKEEVAYL